MTQNIERTLQTIARECAERMFADYGLRLTAIDGATGAQAKHEFFLCGVIGFAGRTLRGSVMLAVGRELLEASAPSRKASLRDWIAELSNQLLGRIKRELLARGVTIQMCTPAVLRGERLSPLLPDDSIPALFSTDRGELSVCIEAEGLEDVALDAIKTRDLPEEGSALLF
jgi:CheY-specific phosphatase CheX